MAKEFGVPPVVFSSHDGRPGVPGQRGPPAAPPAFQAPRPAGVGADTGIPFMSFEIGSTTASSSFSAPVFPANIYSGGGAASFDDEPPLLEELGINTWQIWRKTRSILNPVRANTDLHEDSDLSGPFLFFMAFGFFQLLAGKLHFGIILGWVTVAAFFLYSVINMLAGRNGNLDLYRCVSLIGYCMLPIVLFSAVALFVPESGVISFLMGAVFVLWSTRLCTQLLVSLASHGDEHRGLIALYPNQELGAKQHYTSTVRPRSRMPMAEEAPTNIMQQHWVYLTGCCSFCRSMELMVRVFLSTKSVCVLWDVYWMQQQQEVQWCVTLKIW